MSIDTAASFGFGCWAVDSNQRAGNQFEHFQTTWRSAKQVRDIDGDGKLDQIIPKGIIWMQGESDAAFTEAIARRYFENLTKLMHGIRKELGDPSLPVVIGRISDSGQGENGRVWKYGEIVRKAQKKFVENDPFAALVTETDSYSYSDPAHYNSISLMKLGRRFAEAMMELQKTSIQKPLD